MRAYTMNHLSNEQINSLNDRERHERHHHEHVEAFQFVLRLVLLLLGYFVVLYVL